MESIKIGKRDHDVLIASFQKEYFLFGCIPTIFRGECIGDSSAMKKNKRMR